MDALNFNENKFNPTDRGVGAKAEAELQELAPLVEYYEREMGEWPGRLMLATSFLGDVMLMPGWESMTPEVQQGIQKAQALVVSTMIRILNAQADCSCSPKDMQNELQAFLDARRNGHNN
jgi:hypothetical protein